MIRRLALLAGSLSLLILLGLIMPVRTATAQERTVFWQRWDVNITNVDVADNSFTVSEIYEVDFGGTFRFGTAVIPTNRLESLDNVLVFQDGQLLRNSCGQQSGTYCAQSVQEGLSITYYFNAPITNGTGNFEIRYTVRGALRVYECGDQLWWIAVPADKYGFQVGSSTITVELPPELTPREGVDPYATYGVPADIRLQGSTVVATATRTIGANEVFEIRVQFPHSANARQAGWQEAADQEDAIRPLIDLGLIAVSLLIGLGGPLAVLALWYTRGRDPQIGPVPEFLTEPPSDLYPAVVGALVDEKADVRDVLSTLIDLARRGYIVIEESKTEGFFGLGGRSEFVFKRTDQHLGDLRTFERDFIEALFGGRMEVSLDALKNKFYTHIPRLQKKLYADMMQRKFFRADPQTIRNGWMGLGGGMLAVAFGAFFFAGDVIGELSPLMYFVPVSLGLTGFITLLVAQSMPAKTPAGALEAAKWRAFRQYLANLDRYRTAEEVTGQFERYLPYAIAFGLEHSWIRRFEKVTTMPIPTWYYPTYYGGYRGGGYTAGSPLSGGGLPRAQDVLPGEIARAGGSGGLNDLAGGMSGGLDAISGSLTSLLNSAGSVMTSRPQSSGSGGGFSGGGSFGGGSGGGSRGFG